MTHDSTGTNNNCSGYFLLVVFFWLCFTSVWMLQLYTTFFATLENRFTLFFSLDERVQKRFLYRA
jgi:hypothetical protein